MPDFSEVTDTLAGVIAGLLYPGGIGQPSATGDIIAIFPGWPTPKCLNDALKGGAVQVSIYPQRGEKNVTRYPQEARQYYKADKTLTAATALTADGLVLTLGGAPALGQTLGILVDHATVAYAVQANDTLASIAAAIASLIFGKGKLATSLGPVVTVPSASRLVCNVGVGGQQWVELKRQQKQFMVTVWAPDPEKRARISKLIDTGLADIKWLRFPDYTAGLNIYVRGEDSDSAAEITLYRRDIVYQVEYPTIKIIGEGVTEVTLIEQNFNASHMPEIDVPAQIVST